MKSEKIKRANHHNKLHDNEEEYTQKTQEMERIAQDYRDKGLAGAEKFDPKYIALKCDISQVTDLYNQNLTTNIIYRDGVPVFPLRKESVLLQNYLMEISEDPDLNREATVKQHDRFYSKR